MNVLTARGPRWRPAEPAAGVDLLLASGGDERIARDPTTGRNRYGTTAMPSPREIFLSSSTATTITPRAYRAAQTAWAALSAGAPGDRPGLEAWFDSIRARLAALFGIAGCGVILTGSGTEAELTTLAIATAVVEGPLSNIVIAPAETGSGVLRAAGGAHFLNSTAFGGRRPAGERLSGWADADIEATSVDIRDPHGALRPAGDVDAEACERAFAAIGAGRGVLLHRLETSKTGRSGLTPGAASRILARAPDRVVVAVDCCQLRCSREHIRRMLRLGFIVVITGSKFFGGPPFSGALLVPPALIERIGRWTPPAGLADYTSRQDWPADLRAGVRLPWANEANLGLGLRWVAALAEMEPYFAAPADLRRAVLTLFERVVREKARTASRLHEASDDPHAAERTPKGILPFMMTHPDGEPFSLAETAAVHARLRQPFAPGGAADAAFPRIFHLGQPVAIGRKTALRVCASAPLVNEIIERVRAGEPLEAAFVPCARRLDALFAKWTALIGEAIDQRRGAPSQHG